MTNFELLLLFILFLGSSIYVAIMFSLHRKTRESTPSHPEAPQAPELKIHKVETKREAKKEGKGEKKELQMVRIGKLLVDGNMEEGEQKNVKNK